MNNFIFLTFIAGQAIAPPFIKIQQILSINCFIYFIITDYTYYLIWDKIIILSK